jgi:hypothetical protein
MDQNPDNDKVRDLQEKVLADVRKLRKIDLGILEAEILGSLIDGRKNISELVEHIYGISPSGEGYNASRLRVRRALRHLEKRGIVSTQILGRDKPYRITQHGIGVLANISPDVEVDKVLARLEVVAIVSTMLVGLMMWMISRGVIVEIDFNISQVLFAAFFTLFGLSLGALIRVLRRYL